MPTVPGCPDCHRADAVEALAPGAPVARPAHGPVWDHPTFRCAFCALPFGFDPATGRYAGFRVANSDGVLDDHVFAPPLGPGDAPQAFAKAAARIAEARAADAGVRPFDVFGDLKRAATWMMKGALAAAGAAPDVSWRFGETIFPLQRHVGWDPYAALRDFGRRVTVLLYAKPSDTPREPAAWERSSDERRPEALRALADEHLAEAEALLAWLRDGGPPPPSAAGALRRLDLPPEPDRPAPAVPAPGPVVAAALDALDAQAVRLELAVDARVLLVVADDSEPARGPLVCLRVPVNGLWWHQDEDLAWTEGLPPGAFADLVVRWGSAAPPPRPGAWIRAAPGPGAPGADPLPAESPEALARWLRAPPRADRDPHSGPPVRCHSVELPPLRPRVAWVRFHGAVQDAGRDGPRGTDCVWPTFPDDPALAALFGDPGPYRGRGPALGVPALGLDPLSPVFLYLCSCGEAGCGCVRARVRLLPDTGEVTWADVRFGDEGGVGACLGPTLAFDAAQYARAAQDPEGEVVV